MRFAILGAGAVGARLARQLISTPGVEQVVLRDERHDHLAEVVASLGERAIAEPGSQYASPVDADLVVLCGPQGSHGALARTFVERGISVVSVADSVADVRSLLALDELARRHDVVVAIGCGFAPGLSCVLVRHAAARFDRVDEIHVARTGTGGHACARHHHQSLVGPAVDWRDGRWVERRGGSGRELCWFPDPVGAQDCYRAALPDALLLAPAFPSVQRVTARVGATWRDRLTARLPALWPSGEEGGPGALRVEVRGMCGTGSDTVVYGAMDRPAVAAAAVGALVALRIAAGEVPAGAAGLAGLVEPIAFLVALRELGVRAAAFEGNTLVRALK